MDTFYINLWCDMYFYNGRSYLFITHYSSKELLGEFHPADCFNFANNAWS